MNLIKFLNIFGVSRDSLYETQRPNERQCMGLMKERGNNMKQSMEVLRYKAKKGESNELIRDSVL